MIHSSLVDSRVVKARAANVTAIAFARRGLRQAARRWFDAAHRELRVARILRDIA